MELVPVNRLLIVTEQYVQPLALVTTTSTTAPLTRLAKPQMYQMNLWLPLWFVGAIDKELISNPVLAGGRKYRKSPSHMVFAINPLEIEAVGRGAMFKTVAAEIVVQPLRRSPLQ